MRKTTILLLALLAATLAATAAGAGGGTLVKTGKTGLGRILVDSRGHSLYLFEADKGTRSACYGACAKFWPPLLTRARPVAGAGAKASLLGTTKRKDGKLQVTYHGHPLYLFQLDTKAGATKGQDSHAFGAGWYVLTPSGLKLEHSTAGTKTPPPSSTTTTTPTYTTTGPIPGY
jgi:predicted lipoprotein with Yx(FWY)xxD motif